MSGTMYCTPVTGAKQLNTVQCMLRSMQVLTIHSNKMLYCVMCNLHLHACVWTHLDSSSKHLTQVEHQTLMLPVECGTC